MARLKVSQSRAYQSLLADGLSFISRLMIVNKKGRLQRLIPTAEQIEVFHLLEEDGDAVVGKPRQVGLSTFISAYLFWKWIRSPDPVNIAILSKDWPSSLHILGMWKIFLENLPAAIRPSLSKDTERLMRMEETGATVRAFTSKKPSALRSYTQTYVHLSELGFTEGDPAEVLSNAYSALNGNKLIVESTAAYYMDETHKLIMKAQRGEAALNWTFLPWTNHLEYRTEVPDDWTPTQQEAAYQEQHQLDDEQMVWRRLQIEKHGSRKFQREYPLTLEEAYAQTGSSYFTAEDLQHVTVTTYEPLTKIFFASPERGDAGRYAMGCDVASGRGKDYSTICVLDVRSMQPVAMFKSNTISTEMFAREIQRYSTKYNNALILVESNNWGLPVLNELRHLMVTNLWKQDKKDWTTTGKSKLQMFEDLRNAFANGVITQLDNLTMSEVRSFELDEKSLAPSIPSNLPHHGDLVIALALALQCSKHVTLPAAFTMPAFVRKREAKKRMGNGIGLGARH